MKKAESESAIKHLCHKWREDCGLLSTPPEKLSFREFFTWLNHNYSQYLRFRTSLSVERDVELWFDEELGLMWRR
jgi:hypothetical protein